MDRDWSAKLLATTVPSTTAPLRKSFRFRAILTAAAVSSMGDGVRLAALPLLAVAFTSNTVAITGVAIANRLPWLLVALFSGVIADRVDRRTLMVLVDLVRGAAVGSLALALLLGANHMLILYIAAVMLGIGETLFSTAAQGLLPATVPGEQLATANSRMMTAQLVGSDFIGPTLGSWLFSVNKAMPFAVDAISFVLGSTLLSRVPRIGAPKRSADRKSLFSDIGEGIRWVWHHSLMRAFLLVITAVNLTQSASQSLLVVLAVNEIGMSTTSFGMVLTASGIGAFLGGLLSPRIGNRLGVAYVLLPAIAVTCPLFLLMGSTTAPFMLGIAVALNAFSGLMANVQMISLRQRIVPSEIIGRATSVNMFFAFGLAIPGGALGAGVLAQFTSTRIVYVVCAAIVVVLVFLVAKELRPAAVKAAIGQMLEDKDSQDNVGAG